jgi:DNA-binding response OmpR family regulator
MTDVKQSCHPAYNPRWSPAPSMGGAEGKARPQPPVLRTGGDRLPRQCSGCGSAFLSHEPATGGAHFGTLSCNMCGTVLAHTTAALRSSRTTPERTRLVARNWRTDGCSLACQGGYHSAGAHERYGREQALAEIAAQRARPTGQLRTGRLTCDFDQQRVLVDDTIVPASDFERRILLYLAQHIGTTCRHRDTVAAIWGHDQTVLWSRDRNGTGAWHGVRIHVHRLRRRLGDAADLIETVPNVGYLLRAEPPA